MNQHIQAVILPNSVVERVRVRVLNEKHLNLPSLADAVIELLDRGIQAVKDEKDATR